MRFVSFFNQYSLNYGFDEVNKNNLVEKYNLISSQRILNEKFKKSMTYLLLT